MADRYSSPGSAFRLKPYVLVPLVYLALGTLWIITSDWVVVAMAPNAQALNFLQTSKGWFFVVVSSLLIFVLVRRAFLDLKRAEEEKRELFRSTLGASDHILLNYLNQMQLVVMEADGCEDFDEDILDLAKRISDDTVAELKRLETINAGCPADIEEFLSRRLRDARQAVERVKPAAGA